MQIHTDTEQLGLKSAMKRLCCCISILLLAAILVSAEDTRDLEEDYDESIRAKRHVTDDDKNLMDAIADGYAEESDYSDGLVEDPQGFGFRIRIRRRWFDDPGADNLAEADYPAGEVMEDPSRIIIIIRRRYGDDPEAADLPAEVMSDPRNGPRNCRFWCRLCRIPMCRRLCRRFCRGMSDPEDIESDPQWGRWGGGRWGGGRWGGGRWGGGRWGGGRWGGGRWGGGRWGGGRWGGGRWGGGRWGQW